MVRNVTQYQATLVCWAAIVILWVFAKLLVCPGTPAITENLDRQILTWFATIHNPSLDRLFLSVTWAGSSSLLLPLTVVLTIKLLAGKQAREALFLVSASVGAGLLVNLGKHLIARPRPDLFPALIDIPSGHSFPSGHAAQITAFVLASLWLLKRSMAGPWFSSTATAGGGLIVLVCLSRLYLQVHYPSDVLAGGLTATFWVIGLANLILPSSRPNSAIPNP